jgi:hypothetical protein
MRVEVQDDLLPATDSMLREADAGPTHVRVLPPGPLPRAQAVFTPGSACLF